MGYDDEEDLDDSEFPDEADVDVAGDDSIETEPCPHCGREVDEQAERCPYCGEYVSREDTLPPRKPMWIIFGAVVCLVIALIWATENWPR